MSALTSHYTARLGCRRPLRSSSRFPCTWSVHQDVLFSCGKRSQHHAAGQRKVPEQQHQHIHKATATKRLWGTAECRRTINLMMNMNLGPAKLGWLPPVVYTLSSCTPNEAVRNHGSCSPRTHLWNPFAYIPNNNRELTQSSLFAKAALNCTSLVQSQQHAGDAAR